MRYTVEQIRELAISWGFNDFWRIYPNRKQRAVAERSYVYNLVTKDRKAICEATRNYLERREFAKQSGAWIPALPHASTFLNQRRWEDAFPTDRLMGTVESVTDESASLIGKFIDRYGEGVFDGNS